MTPTTEAAWTAYTPEALGALALFAAATSITPGPNNLMLMASGARFGLRRTLPHWLGVSLGFAGVALVVGFGLGGAVAVAPQIDVALRVICGLFVLYLAWRIATAGGPAETDGAAKPFSFVEAALFQWVNPKVWPMALTAMTVYAPSARALDVVATACAFAAVNFPCVGLWAAAGERLRHWLQEPRRRRVFYLSMAALLVLSMAPVLLAA